MMHKLIALSMAVILLTACENSTGTTEMATPEEMILGNWKVNSATIDGQVYPVTVPGFGQMEALIDANTVQYIYPRIGAMGMPTMENDTLSGTWSLNENNDVLTIAHPQTNEVLLVWNISRLSVGLLETSYQAQSPTNANELSTYKLGYGLSN